MVLQTKGQRLTYAGKTFVIGGSVFANGESDYMGLYGTVTEIRTDEDRETENDTPDIYCEFLVPEADQMVCELEKRFTTLYQSPKKLEEITLDHVIMAPEMLEPLPEKVAENTGYLLSLACFEDMGSFVQGTVLAISNDYGVLIRRMQENLKSYDIIPQLTGVNELFNGYQFFYGNSERPEDGPCMAYVIAETQVFPAMSQEEEHDAKR